MTQQDASYDAISNTHQWFAFPANWRMLWKVYSGVRPKSI
jgi:hypothetical protein